MISLSSQGGYLHCPPSRLILSNSAALLHFYLVVRISTWLEKDGEVVVVMRRCGQDLKVVLYLHAYNFVAKLSMSVKV